MKILHISDTHTFHDLLTLDLEGIDVLVHSGDAADHLNIGINIRQTELFIEWFSALKVPYKIFVPGNHDIATEKMAFDLFHLRDIILLDGMSVVIDGIKFWGMPYTLPFGSSRWAYQRNENKIYEHLKHLPEDVNVIICHGPPKGILDLAYHYNVIENCGSKTFYNHCIHSRDLDLVLFGHIHNSKGLHNAGTYKMPNKKTIYSNASMLVNGNFMDGPIHNGIVLTIEK